MSHYIEVDMSDDLDWVMGEGYVSHTVNCVLVDFYSGIFTFKIDDEYETYSFKLRYEIGDYSYNFNVYFDDDGDFLLLVDEDESGGGDVNFNGSNIRNVL